MEKKKIIPDKRKQLIKDNYKTFKPRNKTESNYLSKVKGGKARAANAIKDDSGKYVTKIFKDELTRILAAQKGVASRDIKNNTRKIEQVIKEAQITNKELKNFYEFGREEFTKMIKTGTKKGTARNSNQMEDDIDSYKGKISLVSKGKKERSNAAEASYKLDEFKQFLSTNFNAANFSLHPTYSFDGEMIIDVPSPEKIIEYLVEKSGAETFEEFLELDYSDQVEMLEDYFNEEYDGEIVIFSSPPKGK